MREALRVESRRMKHAPRLSLPAEDATFRAFDTIVDTRSPAEFAEDHVPGAISCPVLDNEERARVGTIYKQVSPFDAKKLGAALVAKNIARHLENAFLEKPKTWRPLVYCWRGGKRSGAMAHVLREIGWDAKTLEGGYKAYRRYVVDALAALPAKFTLQGDPRRHRQRQEPPAARAGAPPARRCSTSRTSPRTAARCSATCPSGRSRRRRCSRACC